MEEQKKNPAQGLSESEQVQVRRQKLADLQAAGRDPFTLTKFPQDAYSADLKEEFKDLPNETDSGKKVALAGRLMSKRVMGKASFAHLRDDKGDIQLYVRRDELGDDAYVAFKKLDVGDIIGVKGEVFRTKTGELSARAEEITLLAKSLRPLPEKFHGLTDTEMRYRQRYVDLIANPEVKETFVKRSQILKEIRAYLDEKGFLEVDTPILTPFEIGASARPFYTHHNSLNMDMVLRIETELYLKRLIVGGMDRVYEVGRIFRNEIEETLRKSSSDLIIVFEAGFDNNLRHTGKARVQLIADATDPNNATILTSYASNIIADYQQSRIMQQQSPIQIIPQIKLLYNPGMQSAYNFVPGVMGLILMLICAMMTSISIVREKETGTMEVLLVSPVRPLWMIIAKMVPYFVLSCVNLVTILLLSVYVLHVPVAGSLFSLALLSWIFIVVSLLLGLLVSTIARTQVEAMLFSGMVLMMPTVLLSGMIFPIENMPLPLQLISNVIPARWYIVGIKKIMIEGLGISYAQREMGILMLMAVVLLIISLKKFNKRLE